MLTDDTMTAIEARVRELIIYLDDDVNCELALPFPVAYAIQQMGAALRFAPPRALSPMRHVGFIGGVRYSNCEPERRPFMA